MQNLVRVRVQREDGSTVEFNVGSAYAKSHKLDVLDESAYDKAGDPRPMTRKDGRPAKPKTTVSAEAAKKAAKSVPSTDKDDKAE